MDRLRIDAYLYPACPPDTPAGMVLDSFSKGWADHLPPYAQNRLVDGLQAMAHMDIVLFNDHLNALLRRYGVLVTVVGDPQWEFALGYLEDGSMFDATVQARHLRDVVSVAAAATWHSDGAAVDGYVGSVMDEHRACEQHYAA